MWWIIVVSMYVVVVIVLVSILSTVSTDRKKVERAFTYDIDSIFYQMAKTILEEKNAIYDYKNTLSLLYHDKKTIFTKPVLSYLEQFPRLQENMKYLEKLLQKEIFPAEKKKRLDQNSKTLHKIARIHALTHTILVFLTL